MKPIPLFLSLLILLSVACSASAAQTPAKVDAQPTANALNLPKSELENAPDNDFPYSTTVIASQSLYVRNSASHNGEIVGHLMNGEQVTVYECIGLWARIGAGRFVNSVYLSKGCE